MRSNRVNWRAVSVVSVLSAGVLLVALVGWQKGPWVSNDAPERASTTQSWSDRIVVSPDVVNAAPLLHTADPVAIFGGSDGDPRFDLTGVDGAVLMADGAVVAFVPVGQRLIRFDSAGNPRLQVGSRGQGPGQFNDVRTLVRLPGDTLLLVDYANLRVSRVVGERIVSMNPLPTSLPSEFKYGIGAHGEAEVIVGTGADFVDRGPAGPLVQPTSVVASISREGDIDTVVALSGTELARQVMRLNGVEREVTTFVRLGRRPYAASYGPALVVGTGADSVLTWYDLATGSMREVVLQWTTARLSDDRREGAVEQELELLRNLMRETPPNVVEFENAIREAPYSAREPYFDRLVFGADGVLWIIKPALRGDTSWSAIGIAEDGSVRARATGPGDTTPMDFGQSAVLVRRYDADGIASLERRPLQRVPSPSQ